MSVVQESVSGIQQTSETHHSLPSLFPIELAPTGSRKLFRFKEDYRLINGQNHGRPITLKITPRAARPHPVSLP